MWVWVPLQSIKGRIPGKWQQLSWFQEFRLHLKYLYLLQHVSLYAQNEIYTADPILYFCLMYQMLGHSGLDNSKWVHISTFILSFPVPRPDFSSILHSLFSLCNSDIIPLSNQGFELVFSIILFLAGTAKQLLQIYIQVWVLLIMMMMNYFCGIVDPEKKVSLISIQDLFQRLSPSSSQDLNLHIT